MTSARGGVLRSLTGAWQLFLDRPNAMRLFDLSIEGFWRSFGAIVLVVPSYALTALVDRRLRLDGGEGETFGDASFAVAKAVALALDWVAMPILLALAARPLGIADRYIGYVIARNWATVLAMLPYAIAASAFVTGALGQEITAMLSLVTVIIVLRYHYLVVRHSLRVGVGFALGLVTVDFLLSLVIGEGIDRAFGL